MKYKSELMGAIHETAQDLHQAGLLSDEKMKHFDEACLTRAEPLTGDEIRAIREKEQLTQAAFAIHLNIGKNQVSDWERGIKKPSGAALKLLTLVKNKGIEASI